MVQESFVFQSWFPFAMTLAVFIALKLFAGGALNVQAKANLEADVKKSIQEKFRSDNTTRFWVVKQVQLVHEGGNKYSGMVQMFTGEGTQEIGVNVVHDGRMIRWELQQDTDSPSEPEPPPSRTAARERVEPIHADEPPAVQSTWNTRELDIQENGNLAVAVRHIRAKPDMRTGASSFAPADVAKTPWSYYGTVVKLTGTVAVVQDYPPQSDIAIALGSSEACEIVAAADDGAILDLICMRRSGNVKVGDVVTLYG